MWLPVPCRYGHLPPPGAASHSHPLGRTDGWKDGWTEGQGSNCPEHGLEVLQESHSLPLGRTDGGAAGNLSFECPPCTFLPWPVVKRSPCTLLGARSPGSPRVQLRPPPRTPRTLSCDPACYHRPHLPVAHSPPSSLFVPQIRTHLGCVQVGTSAPVGGLGGWGPGGLPGAACSVRLSRGRSCGDPQRLRLVTAYTMPSGWSLPAPCPPAGHCLPPALRLGAAVPGPPRGPQRQAVLRRTEGGPQVSQGSDSGCG